MFHILLNYSTCIPKEPWIFTSTNIKPLHYWPFVMGIHMWLMVFNWSIIYVFVLFIKLYSKWLIICYEIFQHQQWCISTWWQLQVLLHWYPMILVKSLELVWRLGVHRYSRLHLQVLDLQKSCNDLIKWLYTTIVAPAMVTRVKILATNFGVFFVIYVMFSKICSMCL